MGVRATMARNMSKRPTLQLPQQTKRIGLALGGGGARGFAHILAMEALDDMGVRPTRIAGTSIGSIIGAGAAAGLSGKEMRAHAEEILSARIELVRQLFAARSEPVTTFLRFLPIRSSLFNAESLMDLLLPKAVPKTFEELRTPLSVVATDFYAQEQSVMSQGALRRAVAASMALPAIFSPVVIDNRPMVDGGLVNPLPFDLFGPDIDVTIAIDVSGAPKRRDDGVAPSPLEVMTSSSQIFQRSIVREKLRATQPDVFIAAPVDDFGVLDFHRFKEVMAASASVKEQIKRRLGPILESDTAEMVAAELPAVTARNRLPKRIAQAAALLPKPRKKKV
jgi:NTE family protein